MIRKLLLLLVMFTYLQNTSAQEATVLANCFYDNTQNRIIIRLAIRNNTSSGADFELVGIRFGIQYNSSVVTPAGYKSYMYNNGDVNSSLNAPDFVNCIEADTDNGGFSGPNFSISSNPAETSRIAFTNDSLVQKVMQRRYINRSTSFCSTDWNVAPRSYRVAIDIYFTLNDPGQVSYYNLNTPSYGFGSPDFIAQSMNSHIANLSSSKSEIGIVLIRTGNCNTNPYQPFSKNSCTNDKVNPVTIDGDTTVRFITPINGVLSGKVESLTAAEKNNNIQLDWKVENNELVDHYELERKDENGEFKTIAMIMSDNKYSTTSYQFTDKITAREQQLYYRVKTVGLDQVITYSDVKTIKLRSVQQPNIKVFPNPSSDVIRVDLPVANGSYVCRFYNSEGRMVKVENMSYPNSSIHINTLVNGNYFVELYHPQSGKRFYSQFTKQ